MSPEAPVTTSLDANATAPILGRLQAANEAFSAIYPGESGARQPVHTVYGGAHLFKADTARKMGEVALRSAAEYAGHFATLARVIGLKGAEALPEQVEAVNALAARLAADAEQVRAANEVAWKAWTLHGRVLAKLRQEAIEDFRIDFEDGFGNRPDAEEDHHAQRAALEVAKGLQDGTLPPFIGIRIKPFTEELRDRSIRTLDIFVTTLVRACGGKLPPGFVITHPKVTVVEQVTALVELLALLEARLSLAAGSLKIELMIEMPQSIFDWQGNVILPRLVAAANGRCMGAHFGTYDYTAGCSITAAYQAMRHPACDFARHVMQVTLAGTGVMLSDGATNVMPIGPNRATEGGALTAEQLAENRAVVHRAWKLHYDDIQHSLRHGFYQGWDLHPAQLVTRYAAVFAFFLDGLDAASNRLRNFVEKAAQATLVGDVFDDAATGQGLLNFFLRGISCGALTEQEALVTGLSLEEIRSRSFVRIMDARRAR